MPIRSKAELVRIALADIASTTPEEDARITAAALADPENPPLTDEFFARARPGRPPLPAEQRKKQVTIMLDRDVIEHFRSGGKGWQTRVNQALRKAMG